MELEGLVCPKCSGSLDENQLKIKLICPHCGTKFHDKKYIAFIEYLMMNGIVDDIDFFDRTLYGDEIKYKSETEQDLMDETNPDEYEDKTFRMKYIDDNPELAEQQKKTDEIKDFGKVNTNSEEEEEDWQDFNRRHQEKNKSK
ncbi:MAG: hypothetical protein CMG00_02110 [Candidatus Marinimicrobia bacterium]|nr:hypothetical protein [Candidatus Neomarinimicrobiota bacterium]|tara:strand:+ start:3920 stop:4348 length:429 start_codon:yes stop_codon:yes gene_type:complete